MSNSPPDELWREGSSPSMTPPTSPQPSAPSPKKTGASRQRATAAQTQSDGPKRTVCDHCRRRRIRCDGLMPCQHCRHAALACRREHVPKKRGPKRGHGRVIDALRAQEQAEATSAAQARSISPEHQDGLVSIPSSSPRDSATSPSWNSQHWRQHSGHGIANAFTTPSLRPTSRSYLHLIPTCVKLYGVHIYSIMPFVHMPTTRQLARANPNTLPPTQAAFLYSLCALTALHMSGRSLSPPSSPEPSGPSSSSHGPQNEMDQPWEVVGRFFLDEAIAVRRGYDFLGDDDASLSVETVATSFFLSTGFFEIGQDRKSWFYLREAVTLALELGLDDESRYAGLAASNPTEELRRRRTYWQLFVTERSYAVLRGKPIAFARSPKRCGPGAVFLDAEDPEAEEEVAAGFEHLVGSYAPLDTAFVEAWNRNGTTADEDTPPGMREREAATYLALQTVLAAPAPFLFPGMANPSAAATGTSNALVPSRAPTAIQRADLLITQQWLRLIVWQRCLRAGLLSWSAGGGASQVPDSMSFSYPLHIAASTAQVLASLPPAAVEVHGMGIMEKIFDVGSWFVAVLGAAGDGGRTAAVDLLAAPGWGKTIDPIEFFVGTLSAQPNSNAKFADKLLRLAGEMPVCMRGALGRGLPAPAPAALAGWHAEPLVLDRGRQVEVVEDSVPQGEDMVTGGNAAVMHSIEGMTFDDAAGLGLSDMGLVEASNLCGAAVAQFDPVADICAGISFDAFDDTLGFDSAGDSGFVFGQGGGSRSGLASVPNVAQAPAQFRCVDDDAIEMSSPVCYMGEAGLF